MRPFRVFRYRANLLSCAVILSASLTLAAQTYSPHSLVFTGTTADRAALTRLAAIAPGKPVTAAEIEAAMQRISDTGLFAEIRYTVDDRALNFILTQQSASAMLPAIYSNFVFWKPDELAALVHSRLPLFAGLVPTNGNLQQAIQDALAAILLDRGIKANVSSILTQEKTVNFFIEQPAVQIRQVHVDSVSPIAAPRVKEMLQAFASTDFDRHSDEAIRKRLVDTYQDLGFLDITVDLPHYDHPVADPSHILVDFYTVAHEGGQYRVSKLEWPVSSIVSKSDFEKTAQFKTGETASRILLLSTNARIQNEFTRHGYLDAHISVQDQKDPSSHTVEYAFVADPGEIYHLKSVLTPNLTTTQQKDFDKNWKLSAGSIYDGSYVLAFFSRNGSISSFQGYSPNFRITPNHNDHTVELLITLTPQKAPPH
jgi:outer membrane protein insertion porin family